MLQKSETINDLAAALAVAQGEIKNPIKESTNPHFKSKYADLAGVLDVVRPVFSAHGLALSQHPSFDSGIVTVESILTHSSGQWMMSSVSSPVSKNDAQGVGSAITYCRRYALAAIAGVAQDDDDGNGAISADKKETANTPKPTTKHGKDVATPSTSGAINPWTKKDLASVVLSMKTTTELDVFITKESGNIVADLNADEHKAFMVWFDTQRNAMAKKESEGDVPL